MKSDKLITKDRVYNQQHRRNKPNDFISIKINPGLDLGTFRQLALPQLPSYGAVYMYNIHTNNK